MYDDDDLSAELPPTAAVPGPLNDDDDVTATPEVRLHRLKLAHDRRVAQDLAQHVAVEQQLQHLRDSLDIEVRTNAELRAEVATLHGSVDERRQHQAAAETERDELLQKVALLQMRLDAAKRHTEDVVNDLRASLSSGLTERSEVEQLRSHESVLLSAAVTADTRARAADGVVASYQTQIEELRLLVSRQVERHERESREAEQLAEAEREKLRAALTAATEDAAQLRTAKKNLGIAVKQLELNLDAAQRRAAAAADQRALAETATGEARARHAQCHARDRELQRQLMNARADFDRQKLELERARARAAQLEEQHAALRQASMESASKHIALITAAEAKITVADEERGTLARQREALADELEDALRNLRAARAELAVVRDREAELEQACARLQGSIGHADALEQQTNRHAELIAALRQEADAKDAQLESLRARVRQLEDELEQAGGEVQELSRSHAEVAARARELEAELAGPPGSGGGGSGTLVTTTTTTDATTTTQTAEAVRLATQALEAQVLELTKQLSRHKTARRQADDAARRKLRQVAQHVADVLRNAAAVQLALRQETSVTTELRARYAATAARVKDLEYRLEDSDAGRARLEEAFVRPLQAQLDRCTEQMNAAIRERAEVAQQLQAASSAIVSRDTKVTELRVQLKEAAKAAEAVAAERDAAKAAQSAASEAHAREAGELREAAVAARRRLEELRGDTEAQQDDRLRAEQEATERAMQQLADARQALRKADGDREQLRQEVEMLRKYLEKLRAQLAEREAAAGRAQQELQGRFLAKAQAVMQLEAQVGAQRAAADALRDEAAAAETAEADAARLRKQLAEAEKEAAAEREARRVDPEAVARAEELAKQLAAAQARQEALDEAHRVAAAELRSRTQRSERCEERCGTLEAELAAAQAAHAAAAHELKDLQLAHDDALGATKGDLARASAELEQVRADLQLVYRERRVIPLGKEEAVKEVARNVAEALEEAARLADDARRLQAELDDAQRDAEELRRGRENCEAHRKKLTAEAEAAAQAVEAAEAAAASKATEVDALATEVDALRARLDADANADKDGDGAPAMSSLAAQKLEQEKARLAALVQLLMQERDAVSYTHLTLPTIYSV